MATEKKSDNVPPMYTQLLYQPISMSDLLKAKAECERLLKELEEESDTDRKHAESKQVHRDRSTENKENNNTDNVKTCKRSAAEVCKPHVVRHRYKCPNCGDYFASQRRLRTHCRKEHGEETLNYCLLCDKIYSSYKKMMEHTKKFHYDEFW